MIHRMIVALSTRKCNGCDELSFHTHHLTWLGRYRYTHAFPFERNSWVGDQTKI